MENTVSKDFKKTVDIIIPVYNEQDNIEMVIKRTSKILEDFFEYVNFIIIDDGSTDETKQRIKNLHQCKQNKVTIKYIGFSKNFGKDLAIKCGIDHSYSSYCVIMDGDMQHPPEKIIEAFSKIESGFNIIHIMREKNKVESFFRKTSSKIFSKLLNYLNGGIIHLTDFKILDKQAVEIIKQYREVNFSSRGLIESIGLKNAITSYYPNERLSGETKYNTISLVRLAVNSIIAVSIKPLRISIYLGIIISFVSIIYGCILMVEKVFFDQPIPGFTTIAVAIFMMGGIHLLFLGILGEYIGKIFLESKRRPQYLIASFEEYQL
jgi:dolichol-phosphate mannosyltransferase